MKAIDQLDKKGGDRVDQIEELYKDYFHDVYLFARSLTGSEDKAEEVTQETFFKAMKSLDSFNGGCDIRVWLCQIAKNLIYTSSKKQKRFTGDEIPETVPDSGISIEEGLEDKQHSMAIHRILHTMGEPHKEVFSLRVFLIWTNLDSGIATSDYWFIKLLFGSAA